MVKRQISHSCSSLQLHTVVHMPVVVQRQMLMVQTSENCESPAVAVHLNVVVDVPVVQVLLAKFIDSPHHMAAMAVEMGFSAFFPYFSNSSGLSRSCAPVFGALDGEEFFAIEGALAQFI